jgi:CheY-like chemotaxis protein
MVYGMVQRHSAELEIDSEPGRGSTFRLIFPSPTQETASVSYQPAVKQVTQRLRILIVDDDPMLIRSLEDILTSDGHVVTAANGGQTGIDAFTAAARPPRHSVW